MAESWRVKVLKFLFNSVAKWCILLMLEIDFSVEKMFKMTISLFQHEAKTIFHVL